MKRNIPMGMTRKRKHSAVLLTVMLGLAQAMLAGCRGTYESATRDELATAASIVAREEAQPESEPALDGSLSSYVAFALARSPELRASFERWRAATMRISRARRIPEPIIKYSYFVRSVETRVGPQEHKLSLMQAFPWPTALSAGADAASEPRRWRFYRDIAYHHSRATACWDGTSEVGRCGAPTETTCCDGCS